MTWAGPAWRRNTRPWRHGPRPAPCVGRWRRDIVGLCSDSRGPAVVVHLVDEDLSEDQSREVAARIREALARRRMSRQQLADKARISVSTLEKALAGRRPFTLASLLRLEQALDLPLRPAHTGAELAPEDLGAYARKAVSWLEGAYVTLRPSFEKAGAVYAYSTEIYWDDEVPCLAFRESERQDSAFTQAGRVSLPHQSGHIYLTTNNQGQFRLITLSRPTISGELYGLLNTLQSEAGGHLRPVAAPLALIPLRLQPAAQFGRIMPGEASYEGYKARLDRIVGEGFMRLIGPG
jgi:transcriptional regulator with XRE-family HTH domain